MTKPFRLARALAVLPAVLLGWAAAPDAHAAPSYCSPTGDWCLSTGRGGDERKLTYVTFSHRGAYRLCVRGPRGRQDCRRFRLQDVGRGVYRSQPRWRGNFPDRGPGIYTARWFYEGRALGPALTFRRTGPPAARTTFTGTWTCEGTGLAGARVQLWRQQAGRAPRVVRTVATRTDGSFALGVAAEQGTLHYAVLEMRDPGRVRVKAFGLPGTWSVQTPALPSAPGRVELVAQDLTHAGTPCRVFAAMREVRRAWDADVDPAPPAGDILVSWGAPARGVPYALYTTIEWPAGYPQDPAALPEAALHEFAHTVRHAYDGNLAHFVSDAARFIYPRTHHFCDQTEPGFAFNEGWAHYWAGVTDARHCDPATIEAGTEGKVAAALARLQARCRATRGEMVAVLRRNEGEVHSYADFEARLPCRARRGGP